MFYHPLKSKLVVLYRNPHLPDLTYLFNVPSIYNVSLGYSQFCTDLLIPNYVW
jgi:hypothetical protein